MKISVNFGFKSQILGNLRKILRYATQANNIKNEIISITITYKARKFLAIDKKSLEKNSLWSWQTKLIFIKLIVWNQKKKGEKKKKGWKERKKDGKKER